ncbi:pentapeptide repeat-containing protein [Arsenophonus sp.]|uniref:pentapeptide repeat-containing protein n=1 Tax=Arsenophonus sp. TaxID=1872640 RepID=UPI002855CAFD|nr:pentapeptide repeat-containing protein [Arsenophonus sp.]MDR5616752.1 pentapeptide repeat-containing protein [Arsenophonus sp.]
MPNVNSRFLSLNWMSSVLHRTNREVENRLMEEQRSSDIVVSNNQLQLNALQHEELATSVGDSTETTSKPLVNNLEALLQTSNHPINITLPASEAPFFYSIARKEQNRLLCSMLTQEGHTINQQDDETLSYRFNHITDYLSRNKNEEDKIETLAKLLLKPLGEYGANEGEKIPLARQQAIIADWLQYAVLGLSSDKWVLAQLNIATTPGADITKNNLGFHHEYLTHCFFEQFNRTGELAILSPQTRTYYQENVLSRIMPTFCLQPKDIADQIRLKNMMINQPEWGYLHAGAMLLKESGAALNDISLDEIINIGILIETLIIEEKVPAEYSHYFKLPALIHHQLKTENKRDSAEINEQTMPSIYPHYFNYLHQSSQNNPFIQLSYLLQNRQSRPELASQQLKDHGVDEDWLNNYLYKNREVDYPNQQGKISTLPNIDTIFEQQNQHIVDVFKQTEHVLLPQAFNALSEEEQIFLQRAEINQVKVEYNARDSNIHFLPPGVAGLVANNGLIIHIPDATDMLMCSFNGEERIYALEKEQKMGNYKLSRVDRNRDLIFDLIKDHKNTRYNKNFALKIHSPILLKKTDEQPKMALEKLAETHSNKLFIKLHDDGYQKTTRQKVDDFFLSLIPFYTCINEAQKGNVRESIAAGIFDILSFLPFLGKGLQVGGRFSIAMGEATTQGLKIAAKQATIAQFLKQGGKQFISVGIPHITKSVPPEAYIGLGIDFFRSADPGFELLTSGGIKGINSLKNTALKLKPKINGLTKLAETLEKQVKNFPVTPAKSFKIETAYRTELKKKVFVVNIGKKQGKDIFVQINSETGALYGRRYLKDDVGNLTLAPILIRERLYHLKTQGLGGMGSKMVDKFWGGSSDVFLTGSTEEKLDALKKSLANRNDNSVIDLSGANLSDMNLSFLFNGKTNLSLANLSGANLEKATLQKVNLKDANLLQANLIGAKMDGSNLANAKLKGVKMMDADLTKAILTGAKMMEADLTKAILTGAKMTGADLTKAKLINVNLAQAHLADVRLVEANLKGANLNIANLNNANLSQANLVGVKMDDSDLVGANLIEVDLTGANLTRAKLGNTILIDANLTNANLMNANLAHADLTEVDLTGANLTGADLIGANLSEVDFSNAILKELNINAANFSDAILNNTLTLFLPKIWNDDSLDITLNHFNNQSSLLTSINSIDNKYNELKIKLACQLITSLEKSNANLINVTLPLLDIFGKTSFMTNGYISHFVNTLTSNYLKNLSPNLLSLLENRSTITNLFLNYFDQHPHLMVSSEFNSNFIQVLLAARTQGIDAGHSLYEKYLSMPEIQQQLKHEDIKEIFGDYKGNADWSDNNAQNFLLLSTTPNRVLVASENILSQMLHPGLDTKWDHVYLFQDGKCLSPTEYSLKQCYNESFPLFAPHFSYSLNQSKFYQLIETLDLGDQLKSLFIDATKSKAYATKLVDDTYQQELSEVFSRVLDLKQGYILKDENYNRIMKLYDLTSSTDRRKAEHLFSLSAVFTRYSSSAIFGTEEHSPLMLRYYAYALMEKAHTIDPTLIGPDKFNDWKNRLLGTNKAFTCTAVLSDIMTGYAIKHYNDVLKTIQPPTWR